MRIPFRLTPPESRPFDVVGLGLNSVDLVAVVAEYPISNSKQRLQRFGRLCGGQTATAMAVTARLGWRDLPLTSFEAEVVLALLMPIVTLAAVQFLLRRAGQRTPRLGLVLVLQCVLVPASLLLGGAERVHLLANRSEEHTSELQSH